MKDLGVKDRGKRPVGKGRGAKVPVTRPFVFFIIASSLLHPIICCLSNQKTRFKDKFQVISIKKIMRLPEKKNSLIVFFYKPVNIVSLYMGS